MTPQPPDRADPRALLRVLWRWKLLFVAIVIAAPVATYFIVKNKPKTYQSSALVSVNGATGGAGNGSFSTSNILAIARLVTTVPVARKAASLLNPPGTAGEVLSGASAVGDSDTSFITITAQARDPGRAAAITNALATALGSNRTNAAIGSLNAQIATLQKQLSTLPPGLASQTARGQIEQQLSQLRALKDSQGNNISVIQAATPNATPISPHVRRTVELGLVIGLLLAIGAVALAENSDRRLRTPADLEEMTKLPLLSAIPAHAFSSPLESLGADEEAFQMLRAALTYFNIDRRLTTVVITSAGQGDGKTTVAIRLALATARAGKRVLLVDADLRRPQVNERLGFDASAGLGAVLVGEATLSDVLRPFPVDSTKGGELTILPAGPPAPNPPELLSSAEMSRVLSELGSQADLVIVDTPAALVVSDSMPLLQAASGVVLVARLNKSTRDAIRRLHRVVASVNGTVLGVVATGARSGPGYEGYSYGYDGGQHHAKGWRRRRTRRSQSRAPDQPLKEPVAKPTEYQSS